MALKIFLDEQRQNVRIYWFLLSTVYKYNVLGYVIMKSFWQSEVGLGKIFQLHIGASLGMSYN